VKYNQLRYCLKQVQSNPGIASFFVRRNLWRYIEGGGKQMLRHRKFVLTGFRGRKVRAVLHRKSLYRRLVSFQCWWRFKAHRNEGVLIVSANPSAWEPWILVSGKVKKRLEVIKHLILGLWLCYQWKFYDACPVTLVKHCYTSEVRASQWKGEKRHKSAWTLITTMSSIYNSTEIFH
jgi:hypothetical protein